MKAVVIEAPGTVAVKQIEDPTPGPLDAVIQVEACGICGTDIHVLEGELKRTPYPIVPGHEFCGEVVAVGSEVSNLHPGQFVAVDPNLYCGHCRFCRAGRENLCENYDATGVTRDGACAEYVRVRAANAIDLPADIPRSWGALVEPLSCAVHGFDQIGARLADSYLVYGAGTMGLMLAQLARHAGARQVDMVDTNTARFDRARQLGADRVAVSAEGLESARGWDVVIDATGAVAAIEDGLRRVTRGGTFLQFGVASGDSLARFSPFRVYNDEIKIIGSMAVYRSFERALALLVRGVIDCDAMITDRFSLEDYPHAIETFRQGTGLKIQVG